MNVPLSVSTVAPACPVLESLSGRAWVFAFSSDSYVQKLCQTLDISTTLAQILGTRISDPEAGEAFLSPSLKDHLPDPRCLPDMEPFLTCLAAAIRLQKPIAIWGDYDVDGATSAALWVRFLRHFGISATIYIPDRMTEGYGLNVQGLRTLHAQGIQTVIIVDCGTTAFDELTEAQNLGLEILIIDHHMPQAHLPPCQALVNPKRWDASPEAKPFESLAAVGLSFFCAMALNRFLRHHNFYTDTRPEPALIPLLDLVALGTVCDVMPLLGINRTLVAKGIEVLAQRQNLGLKTLSDVAGLKERPTAGHCGFLLGPRINAGGRIGKSSLGTELLSTLDPTRALQIAMELNALNQGRQTLERHIEEDAIAQAEAQGPSPVIVVAGTTWHWGVIGITASRLKDRFHKPTFVIGWQEGEGKGSARGMPGTDVGTLILEAAAHKLIVNGGGHTMAGGLSLTPDQLPAFHTFLQNKLQGFQPQAPQMSIAASLTFASLTPDLLDQVARLAPFGMGNPQPVFAFHDVRLQGLVPMGETHFRLHLVDASGARASAVAFRARGRPLGDFLLSAPRGPFHLAASAENSSYGLRLIVEDIALS